jgi:hypothetical protein
VIEDKWPKSNPAWERLIEQSWRALEKLQHDGKFDAMRSELGQGSGEVEEVSSLVGTEAILDLRDRAPEWARNIDWIGALYASLQKENQIQLLESTTEEIEIEGCEKLIDRHAKEVESELEISPVHRLSPVATATLVSVLTRAQLLPDRPNAAKLTTDPRLIATLIFQSRVLTDNSLVTDMKVHPYALYQIRRSLVLAGLTFEGSLREAIGVELDRIRDTTLQITETLLARSQIGGVRDGENVALVFCAAALALGPPDPRYVIEALSAAVGGQSPRGDWQQGRRIGQHLDPDTGRQLFVSTHEVALAFAEAILWLGQVPGASSRLKPDATEALQLAVDYLRESRVEFNRKAGSGVDDENALVVGWTSSHVYGHTHVDTRATSAALRLTVATRAIAEQIRSVRALEEFEEVWDPDVDHTPSYLKWKKYIKESEPDSENPILGYLDENFVQAVEKRKQEDRRPWARIPAMSAILFGPPGTTKTTIVKAMAQGLGWPLVTLSPGTFIRDGLENVEKRAGEVFSHLRDLTRVVVLFDECDELFRKRRGFSGSVNERSNEEARSISAFMTASMLPKLQGLRDNGQIFFVIATNYLEEIDPAAKRIGRIDRVVGVGWPDTKQRGKIIEQTLAQDLPKGLMKKPEMQDVIAELAGKTHYCVRGELVELARGLAAEIRLQKASGKDIDADVVGKLGVITPSITADEYTAFRESAKARSACHHANMGEMKE